MKNIVICCDGTGNEYGTNNTNVVETYALAEKSDQQIAFYDPGVGTGGWEYSESTGDIRALNDQATGLGLQKNVNDAYAYLMESYETGDRLYLFGFSRGAFTARSVAGMLHKVGLLSPDNDNLLEYAAKLYNTEDQDERKRQENREVAAGFKRTFSRECPVHFIGVWDTVESLVMNAGKRWHDATLNPDVSFAYHAISIDERRKDFPPCPWNEADVTPNQYMEQVWFAGVHADVGGWYDERGLSNITLKWMLNKARTHGMKLNTREFSQLKGNPHDELHNSYTGLWKIRGKKKRVIPEGARIHESVFERKNRRSNNYKPDNLPSNYEVVSD